MQSYPGFEIKKQLTRNLTCGDKEKETLAKNTLEKYWYSSYKKPHDEAYYFVGKKQGGRNYILQRDESKSIM